MGQITTRRKIDLRRMAKGNVPAIVPPAVKNPSRRELVGVGILAYNVPGYDMLPPVEQLKRELSQIVQIAPRAIPFKQVSSENRYDLKASIDKMLAEQETTGRPVLFATESGKRYAILKQQGEGGQAAVYLADSIGANVVVPKEIKELVRNDILLKKRFVEDMANNVIALMASHHEQSYEELYAKFEIEGKVPAATPTTYKVGAVREAVKNEIIKSMYPLYQSAIEMTNRLNNWDWIELFYKLLDEKNVAAGGLEKLVGVAVKNAVNSRLNSRGCLKIARAQDKLSQELMESEMNIASKVNSPFVARLTDKERHKESGNLAAFFEYIDGMDVAEVVSTLSMNGQLMPFELAALAGNHVAQGLIDIHGKKLAHKDLCGRNLRYGINAGYPFILDFGLASGRSRRGIIEGKDEMIPSDVYKKIRDNPDSESPVPLEQLQAADMHALGHVMYQAVTGARPFALTENEETAKGGHFDYRERKLLLSDPENYRLLKPHEVCPDVPEKLSELIFMLLNPDWTKRPTALEFQEAIKNGYMYDGYIPSGVSMRSLKTFLKKLYPGRYDEDFLERDVRGELDDLRPLVLAQYRNEACDSLSWKEQEPRWAKVPQKPENPVVPIEQDKKFAGKIDYRVRRAQRKIKDAIGQPFIELLMRDYLRRLDDNRYTAQQDLLKKRIYDYNTKGWEETYDCFQRGIRPLALKGAQQEHPGRVFTKEETEGLADENLMRKYHKMLNFFPLVSAEEKK